jgi:hypothetical protein
VRAAMLISLAALTAAMSVARADESFRRVTLDAQVGYVVPEEYAEYHKDDLRASMALPPKIQGFWTPSDTSVMVAERLLREKLQDAAKDPIILFPELVDNPGVATEEILANEKRELGLILQHYPFYQRQFVGLIIDGNKIVLCNYSFGPKTDPSSDYVFIQNVFDQDADDHFLQCRVDPFAKICTNISYIGTWKSR